MQMEIEIQMQAHVNKSEYDFSIRAPLHSVLFLVHPQGYIICMYRVHLLPLKPIKGPLVPLRSRYVP